MIYKSRQLGITTLFLAIALFWCGIYQGLQGAIAIDKAENMEETVRARIAEMLDMMSADYELPIRKGRSGHNKMGIHFEGKPGSVLQYLVAGVRKSSSGLGRSRSLNFLMADEVASWGDPDQIETLKAALSDLHPNRLYVFAATSNGYNHFYDMWNDALADTLAQKAIFIAWWRNERYAYDEDTDLFEQYGTAPLSQDEAETQDEIWRRYKVRLTMRQWAWYRHHANPSGGSEIAAERDERFKKEFPSTPEEGFRSTGSALFDARMLGRMNERAMGRRMLPFCYEMDADYEKMQFIEGRVGRRIDLKIWEEPVRGGSYIVSGDSAYGSSDTADAFCAQVCRSYADRIEQVAEFWAKTIKPYQFTWIMAHLCGLYENVRLIFEINGPGAAVDTEFRNIRTLASLGKLGPPGMPGSDEVQTPFLAKVKTYLYHRPDSLGAGYMMHWKMSGENRTPLLIRTANNMAVGDLVVNSVACIDEARRLRQSGSVIEPEGAAHDDRIVALALCNQAWLDWDRAVMRASGRTWDAEHQKDEKNSQTVDPIRAYLTYTMNSDRAERARRNRTARAPARAKHWSW